MSEKMLAYKILHDRSVLGLAVKVEMEASDGWVPQGGVAVSVQHEVEEFYQAMTKNVSVHSGRND